MNAIDPLSLSESLRIALTAAIEDSGIPKKELARRSGIDVAHIRRALAPGANPKLEVLDRLVSALGGRFTITVEHR